MTRTIRAGVSVVLLAGFYVLAAALVVGIGALGFGYGFGSDAGGRVRPFAIGFALFLIVVLLSAVLRVLAARPASPTGVRLTPERAPELWQVVRELAALVGTREPDEIRLVARPDVEVSEASRLLGLFEGWRTMSIGMPVLGTYTVAQLRAVLAHELGHYSHRDTRVAAVAHRGRMMIDETVEELSGSVVGAIFSGYAALYIWVERAVSRHMEFEADRVSAAVAGRPAAVSGLRDARLVAAAWDVYLARFLQPARRAGYLPADAFGGFDRLLAERRAELTARSAEGPEEKPSRWDTHPPVGLRIAAIETAPDAAGPADQRAALVLVPGIGEAARRLQEGVWGYDGCRLLPWEQLSPAAASGTARRYAEDLFRAAARLAGHRDGHLGLVLDLLAAGRHEELARHWAAEIGTDAAPEQLGDAVRAAIEAVLTDSGAGRWRHRWTDADEAYSWAGPAELVDADGGRLPVSDLLALAGVATTVGELRARLAALGVPLGEGRRPGVATAMLPS